jgi:starvation-inducible DNA-binding protein
MGKISTALDQNACEQIAHTLSQILADTYVLYLKTQNFHWNITDSRFHSLHEMFEEQYKQLAEMIDELAERIRTLKQKSPGAMREFLELATIAEAEGDYTGNDMLHMLCHDHETLAVHIRSKIQEATGLGDEGTGDLLIQQLRMHEKTAWMLRSHLFDEN